MSSTTRSYEQPRTTAEADVIVTALADELRKADQNLTREQAQANVYREHPALYQAMIRAEEKEKRN